MVLRFFGDLVTNTKSDAEKNVQMQTFTISGDVSCDLASVSMTALVNAKGSYAQAALKKMV